MAVYSTLPKTNLKAEDIRDTLNANGGSVGNYAPDYFGANANISMWSRYKPMRIKADFINLFENGNWKGTDGQCGIDFSGAILTNYTEVVGKVTSASNNGWVYDRPTGNANSPLRLGDFRGYSPSANPPVRGVNIPARVAVGGTLTAQIMYSLSTTPPEDVNTYAPGNIGLNEFSYRGDSFKDYHFGIVVTDMNNNRKGRSFSGGTGLASCTYSVAGLAQGSTYKAWPLIAKTAMGQYDIDMVNTYICLPLCGPEEFKIVSKQEADGLKITVTCKYLYDINKKKTGISYSISITSETSMSLSNNAIQMRFSTSEIQDPLMAGERSVKLPDITVGPGSPYSENGIFSINSGYEGRSYYVYASFATSNYVTGKLYPMQEVMPDL